MSAQATLLEPQWKDHWAQQSHVRDIASYSPAALSLEPNRRVAMWVFRDEDGQSISSRLPVKVSVELEQPAVGQLWPSYLLSNDSLHVFASAPSYEQALREFQEQVVHFYMHYIEMAEETLDDDARAIQNIYRSRFYQCL